MSEVRCTWASATENPCSRPGTVEQPDRLPAGVKLCEVHAAIIPLWDDVNDLGLALEKLEELEEYAEESGNRPLLGLMERARAEFSERLQFLEEHLKSVSHAGR